MKTWMNLTNNMIFIPGEIPSLKNSKVMGKFTPPTVKKWLRTFGISSYNSRRKEVNYFVKIPAKYNFKEICKQIADYKDYPLLMGFHFVRNSNRMWDFGNACQIIQDMMVAHDVIPDDNVNYLLPFPMLREGKYWSYSKDTPGVYIRIM